MPTTDPFAAAAEEFQTGFFRGLNLSTVIGQRLGSRRHQAELELQNALQMDDPGEQALRLKDLVLKGRLTDDQVQPFLQRAEEQDWHRRKLGTVMSFGNVTADTQERMIAESKAELAAKGHPLPKYFKDFEEFAKTQRERETAEEKRASTGRLITFSRINNAPDPAIRKAGMQQILSQMEELGVPEETREIFAKLGKDSTDYMLRALSRDVIEGDLTVDEALSTLRRPDAPQIISDLVNRGKVLAAQQEAPIAGTVPPTAVPGVVEPALAAPAIERPPTVAPTLRRLGDVRQGVNTLKTDLRRLEISGDAKPGDVLGLRKEIAKRQEDLRTLEEEHGASIQETATPTVKTYVERLGDLGSRVESKQDAIRDIETRGLAETPGGRKRVEALNKDIDELNKQLEKTADVGPILKDEHLTRALQDAGVPVTDKLAVAKTMADKETAAPILRAADEARILAEVRKSTKTERAKIRSEKVDDARGGYLKIYSLDPETGKVKELDRIRLGRDPIEQVQAILKARVAGLTTNITEIDKLSADQAEELLVRLNRADPIKALIAEMLRGAGPKKTTPEDILKKGR